MLELLGLGSNAEAGAELARRLGGVAYTNHADESDKRPYSSLIRVATDDIEAVRDVADVSLHVGFSRLIKAPAGEASPDRVIASFGLIHNPAMTHRQTDDHWRDVHGPLALRCHLAMCDYTQLSVLETLSGEHLDGIALCAFDNRDDLHTRFFNDDEAKAEVIADVSTFADASASPRRVVLEQVV